MCACGYSMRPCCLCLAVCCARGTPLTWWSVGLVWWKGEAVKERWERTGAVASMGSMFEIFSSLLAQEWKFEIHNFYLLASSLCGGAQLPLGHARSDDHGGEAANVTDRGDCKSHSLASTVCSSKYIANWEDCGNYVGTLLKWRR